MSSLKRLLNEEDEDLQYPNPSSVSLYGPITPIYQGGVQDDAYSGYYPRQTSFHSFDNYTTQGSQEEMPIIEYQSSVIGVFDRILPGFSVGDQLGALNFGDGTEAAAYDLDDDLETWGRNTTQSPLLGAYSSPQPSSYGSSQDSLTVTHSPSLFPDSSIAGSDVCSSTAGDDDADKVCYGMLYNVDVKLIGDMAVIDTKLRESSQASAPGRTAYQRFTLSEQQEHVLLVFKDDATEFGYLRSGPGKVLSRLLSQDAHVDFEPIAPTNALRETIARAKKPVEAMVKVDVNVYGPRAAARTVGAKLSEGKLWLQKSDHARQALCYENPHVLKIQGGEELQEGDISSVNGGVPAGRQPREERLRRMMMEVYDSTERRQFNRELGDKRLKNDLLDHQQEALAFMLERESGDIPLSYRLWNPVTVEGQEWYRHKITNVKQMTKPDERGGGILADEMGMGKSLSILSLVVKTLDDGRTWAVGEDESSEKNKDLHYSGSTLVVVSSALLIYNWIDEIEKHVDGSLKYVKYHGPNREKDIDKIKGSDVVVTTYNTLSAEFEKKSSILHKIGWYRIVLDEAHIIRRPATTFYHSCTRLYARSRWCLTGTPIQNKLADIGALFAFIRATPFDNPATFRRYIEVPFDQSVDNLQKVKERLITLLESLCLRRTKNILHLPGLSERVIELDFSPEEREQYDKTKKILMRIIKQKVGEIEKSSKFGLFQANLQMRILCNHGTFQKPFSWGRRSYRLYRLDEREAAVSALGQNAEITCDGCRQPMPILGSGRLRNEFDEQCAHVFCSECLEDSDLSSASTPALGSHGRHCPACDNWMRLAKTQRPSAATAASAGSVTVPLVRVDGPGVDAVGMSDGSTQTTSGADEADYFNTVGYSTKMEALIRDVQVDVSTTKSIIFSCWTRTLHLVAKHLEKVGVKYHKIDGDCPLSQRQEVLGQFAKDEEKRVLIMTTGTGAFGLNLTCANRVFIIELQWNPSVENQAIARAIRFGQGKKVLVTRYIIKSTVEEEMRSQQNVKKELATIGFGKPASDASDEMDQS
ncbi:SNF2 family domain-containing protein [Colletotrichum orchidophilum]|uniref:SNF2 family domain-containing protein n=1 Tax=Colletotrichum orchidophilum TaxID=1209926 RepID=A0A1G4ASJ6_9PEZI|nr:SNF2 family domain-containing protein [Colletotrichum orchidophilum]OHE92071.1 SNF2 family domain-containing protein [Colletotrichum orchidophilum]